MRGFITCNHVKEDEIDWACSTHGEEKKMHIWFWWEIQKETDH
jgi:hypothetical protein